MLVYLAKSSKLTCKLTYKQTWEINGFWTVSVFTHAIVNAKNTILR